MARTAGFDDDLPAVMIGKNEGAALRASGTPRVRRATFQEFITPENKDIVYGNSSQGPTAVDFAVKPDLTSVAVNVLSSITCVGKPAGCPGDGSGWAFFSGTSMSTPHIAGSAAVLLQLYPDWSPAQIKSALVNRADLVVKDAPTACTTSVRQRRAQGARTSRSRRCNNLDGSCFGEFRQSHRWASDVGDYYAVQPDREH